MIRKITEEISTWEEGLRKWKEFQKQKETDEIPKHCAVSAMDISATQSDRPLNKDGEGDELCNSAEDSGKSCDLMQSCDSDKVEDGIAMCDRTETNETCGPPLMKKLKTDDAEKDGNVVDDSVVRDCVENVSIPSESEKVADDDEKIKFRISCKCTGKLKNYHSPQEFAINMGTVLAQKYGWTIELRKPQLEVSVHVSDEYMLIGLPVTAETLSRRHYIKKIGIRSTIAWCMCNLADIKEGDIVLDPMCGTGTILLEASMSWKNLTCVGGDNHFGQLKFAKFNIKHANMEGKIQLLHSDVKALPLKDACVDCVVSDIPFGLNHSTVEDVKVLYPAMQKEIGRVVKPGGRAVILTSGTMVDFLVEEMTGQKSRIRQFPSDEIEQNVSDSCEGTETAKWVKLDTHYLKIALVHAYICVFQKKG
ncbi:THUMP domain-containing protein 2-like isoform X2 [Ptychodera flava]